MLDRDCDPSACALLRSNCMQAPEFLLLTRNPGSILEIGDYLSVPIQGLFDEFRFLLPFSVSLVMINSGGCNSMSVSLVILTFAAAISFRRHPSDRWSILVVLVYCDIHETVRAHVRTGGKASVPIFYGFSGLICPWDLGIVEWAGGGSDENAAVRCWWLNNEGAPSSYCNLADLSFNDRAIDWPEEARDTVLTHYKQRHFLSELFAYKRFYL